MDSSENTDFVGETEDLQKVSKELREKLQDIEQAIGKVINLLSSSKNPEEIQKAVEGAHLRLEDTQAVIAISNEKDEKKLSDKKKEIVTKLFMRNQFHTLNPNHKRIVYELLKRKMTPNKGSIHALMHELKINGPITCNIIYRFMEDLNSLECRNETINTIISEYEKMHIKPEPIVVEEKSPRKNRPVIVEPSRMSLDPSVVLKQCQERFKIVSEIINGNQKYYDVVSMLLKERIWPESVEGKQLLDAEKFDVNDVKVINEYFGLLNLIVTVLNVNDSKKDLEDFVKGLTELEVEFINDMECKGLSLSDADGKRMLRDGCANASNIKDFYTQPKSENAGELFAQLNSYEKALVEDLMACRLTPEDKDGKKMIAERCIDPKKIEAYFSCRDNLDRTVDELEEIVGKTNEDKDIRKVQEVPDDVQFTSVEISSPIQQQEVVRNRRMDRRRQKEQFFTRVEKFFGNMFKHEEVQPKKVGGDMYQGRLLNFITRDLDKSDEELQRMIREGKSSPFVRNRISRFKMRNLDGYDDELIEMNSGKKR